MLLRRWLKFNAVGIVGIGLQLLLLQLLAVYFRMNYLWATGIAVELTVVHNFFWHESFTWRDRSKGSVLDRLKRFFRFNLANGVVSLLGNLGLMWVFSGVWKWPYVPANLAAIGICSLLNFYVSHKHVFVDKAS